MCNQEKGKKECLRNLQFFSTLNYENRNKQKEKQFLQTFLLIKTKKRNK